MVAECPECETEIPLPPGTELWDLIECPSCGTHLEVIDLDPPEVDYVLDEEEEEDELGEEDEDEEWLDEEEEEDEDEEEF